MCSIFIVLRVQPNVTLAVQQLPTCVRYVPHGPQVVVLSTAFQAGDGGGRRTVVPRPSTDTKKKLLVSQFDWGCFRVKYGYRRVQREV